MECRRCWCGPTGLECEVSEVCGVPDCPHWGVFDGRVCVCVCLGE